MTLYAKWTANTYTVTYNGNGATGGSTAASTHTYDAAKNLTANGFTKTGYSFAGWNTAANGSGTNYSNSQSVSNLVNTNGGGITLFAKWTINQYTITYNANGGTCSTANTKQNYATAMTMPTATRDSGRYTFNGWYTAASGGSKVNYTSMPAENKTVYAQWTPVSGTGTSIMKGAWYGDKVNYSAYGVTEWKVFSKDGSNIFIISGGIVAGQTLTSGTNITVDGNYVYVTSAQNGTDSLKTWMADTSKWSHFVSSNSTLADLCTGGPTLSQMAVSCNGKLGTTYTAESLKGNVYIHDSLYKVSNAWWYQDMMDGTAYNYTHYPDGHLLIVDNWSSTGAYGTRIGVRPLVRLKSNVKMTWNGSQWNLST